jgi:NAD-dependent dihydropyrimidine dehydrogenase PreA subunit
VRANPDTFEDEQRVVLPIIDPNKCSGCGPCVEACPQGVLQVCGLTAEERRSLTLRGMLKAWHHGNQQAKVIDPARCTVCGKCARICPKHAIELAPQSL